MTLTPEQQWLRDNRRIQSPTPEETDRYLLRANISRETSRQLMPIVWVLLGLLAVAALWWLR